MLAIFRGAFLLLLLCVSFAQAADTGWMQSPQNDHARIRLRAEKTDNGVHALLYVQLAPGWKTYWRSPGEGGVAPKISWNTPVNAQWFWPVPSRFDISGLTTQGYHEQVIIPMVIQDAASMTLAGTLTLSTCSNVCVLTDYPFTLDLNQPDDALFAQDFTAAMTHVPADNGVADRISAQWHGDTVTLIAHAAAGWDNADIFFDPLQNGVIPGKPHLHADGENLTIKVPVTDEWGDKPGNLNGEWLSFVLTDKGKAQQSKVQIGASTGVAEKGSSPAVALWRILLIALAGGLILNLMPCVLPVMGMKLSSVLNAGNDRQRIRLRFLVTTGGILTSFAALAGLMTILKLSNSALGWGIQFQSPWFIGLMVAVTFIFSLNLFGVFQLFLPSSLSSRFAVAGGNTLTGSFCEGAFATLLATPCSAPFLGTAVAWALSSTVVEMWIVFITLGIGMSLPWLLVALLPQCALLLPRPGKWMNTLKMLLGLMMFGSSLWLVTLLSIHTDARTTALISLGLTLITVLALLKSVEKRVWQYLALTAVLALFGGYQINTLINATGAKNLNDTDAIHWQPLSEEAITQALAQNKKVFVDISADWCVTCKVNEHRVLNQPEVIAALNQPDVVALRGDWSKPSDDITRFLQKRNRYAIPFNEVYIPGRSKGEILPPLLDTQTVLDALNNGKSS